MRSFIVTGLLIVSSYVHAQVSPAVNRIGSEPDRKNNWQQMTCRAARYLQPGIEKAAAFITKEFNEAGLKPLPGSKDYNQTFTMADPEFMEGVGHIGCCFC